MASLLQFAESGAPKASRLSGLCNEAKLCINAPFFPSHSFGSYASFKLALVSEKRHRLRYRWWLQFVTN